MANSRMLAVLALLAATAVPARAEPSFPRISAETDPNLFFQNGYGFSLGASAAPHWHLQLTEFAFDLYKLATPSDWRARVDRGSFLWVKYYVRADNRGLFTGAALSALTWDYTRADTPGAHAIQDQYGILPYVGYRWFPTDSGLYLLPWVGVGLPFHTTGSDTIGSTKYSPKLPVFPLAAVHVGYEF